MACRKDRSPVTRDAIEAIIVLIGAGLTYDEACASDAGFPSRFGIWIHLKKNPDVELTARITEACKRSRLVRGGAFFDAMIEKVESGVTVEEACRSTPGACRADSIDRFLNLRPHLRERFEQAKLKARSFRRGYDKADVIRIVAAAGPAGYIAPLTQAFGPNAWASVVYRLCRNPEHREQMRAVIDARRIRKREDAIKARAAARERKKREARPTHDLHLAALRSNPVYANVAGLLHLGKMDDAEDIIQDGIVAALECEAFDRKRLIGSHYRKVSSGHMRTKSLDAELFNDGGRGITRADLIPASPEIGDVYAW